MSNRVFEKLELYYSNISKNLREYEVEGLTLTGVMNDGKRILYNEITNDIRYLPDDPDYMTDDDYRNEFGYRVRDIMVREGVNQVELENRTGIPQPMLSGYLNGRTMPSYGKAARIARALGCSMDEFVYKG